MFRIAFALLAFAFPSFASAADWPQFRGPGGTGIAADAAPPTTWSEKNIAWKYAPPGPGSSSPIVYGDRVFITCYSGYGVDAAAPGEVDKLVRHLVCLDRKSGKELWKCDVPGTSGEDPYRGYITEHGYAGSTPICDGESVFAFFGKAGVVCCSLDGKKLWQTSVGTDSDIRRWGSASSPLVYKNLVIVNASSESRAIVALDKVSGKEAWKAKGNKLSLSFGTPALITAGDRTELVVAMPGEIWSLNPDTSKMLWYSAIKQDGNISPTVVPGAGTAYVTGGFQSKGTVALKLGGKEDVTKTNLLWTVATSSYVPTPILHDGRLVIVAEDGQVTALKTERGEIAWQERLSVKNGKGGRLFYASPVSAGDTLFIQSRRNGVVVFKAGTAFEQLAQNPPLDDSDFNATPALVGKQLFLRSNKFVYCIE